MHHGTRILVLSIAQALAASAAAQDDGADAAEGATAQLAEVVVVGSRIRRVDAQCKSQMVARAVASVESTTLLAQLYRSEQPTMFAAK
mgnify:CR=1 FL=1